MSNKQEESFKNMMTQEQYPFKERTNKIYKWLIFGNFSTGHYSRNFFFQKFPLQVIWYLKTLKSRSLSFPGAEPIDCQRLLDIIILIIGF
jgi:hypothetical protein